jgi:hypothetical protein
VRSSLGRDQGDARTADLEQVPADTADHGPTAVPALPVAEPATRSGFAPTPDVGADDDIARERGTGTGPSAETNESLPDETPAGSTSADPDLAVPAAEIDAGTETRASSPGDPESDQATKGSVPVEDRSSGDELVRSADQSSDGKDETKKAEPPAARPAPRKRGTPRARKTAPPATPSEDQTPESR